jgi:membrane protease YdiL (CAAX protease family)
MKNNEDFPNVWHALLILAVVFGAQMLVGAAFYDFGGRLFVTDANASSVITVLVAGIALPLLMAYKGLNYAELFHSTQTSIKAVVALLGLPILFVSCGGAVLLTGLVGLIAYFFPIAEQQQFVFEQMLGGGVASFIAICLIAPFVEEMLFRGIFLRSFLVLYSPTRSVIYASLLFALAHRNIYQGAVALLIGLFFGWLYVKTRSLWPSIMGHASYNFVCVVLAWTYSPMEEALLTHWGSQAAAAALLVVGLSALRTLLAPRKLG